MARTLTRSVRYLPRRWATDTRGSSMITTAVTLPLFLIILFGIWYLFWWLMVKQALHHGVEDAARQATEFGRYWLIDPADKKIDPDQLKPLDYYEIEARRIIESRLSDIGQWNSSTLKTALIVRVEEPPLAFALSATSPTAGTTAIIQEGFFKELCDPEADTPGKDYRVPENIRLRVYAELRLPIMPVRIPWSDSFTVTLKDRAIGYVQCPRWRGKAEGTIRDQSERFAAEFPYLPYRNLQTPGYPTITPIAPLETPTTMPTSGVPSP